MHVHRIAAAALAGLLLAGCQVSGLPGISGAPDAEPRAIRYRRVAIVEFHNRTPYTRAAAVLTDQLRQKLAEWTTGTDVIVLPPGALPGLQDPFLEGRIPLDALVEARRRHLVDALIVGSVDEHNPYWKPSVHVTLKVIDTSTAAIPFQLSEGWDANRRKDSDAIEAYYRRNKGRDDCRFGPDLFVTSPTYFLRFVADGIAQRLVAGL